MNSYKLSFGEITIINKSIAEVVVDEGIVIDEIMIDEYHDFLLTNLDAPFSLIINKKNPYSYTFEAQKTIVNLREIKAIAVVVVTHGALMSTEMLLEINKNSNWNLQMFNSKEKALKWLDNFNDCK